MASHQGRLGSGEGGDVSGTPGPQRVRPCATMDCENEGVKIVGTGFDSEFLCVGCDTARRTKAGTLRPPAPAVVAPLPTPPPVPPSLPTPILAPLAVVSAPPTPPRQGERTDLPVAVRPPRPVKLCGHDGCPNQAKTGGMCGRHSAERPPGLVGGKIKPGSTSHKLLLALVGGPLTRARLIADLGLSGGCALDGLCNSGLIERIHEKPATYRLTKLVYSIRYVGAVVPAC